MKPMFLLYIYLFLAGIFLIWLGLFVWSLTFTKAPFVPIPRKVLGKISEALEISPGNAVYDLGCGDGRVLIACHKKEPKARYIGIDRALAAVSVANLRVLPLYSENMLILRGDFMKQNLSDGNRIFTYLYPLITPEPGGV